MKKVMTIIILLSLSIINFGCSSDSDSPASKNLFSTWFGTNNPNVFDFTGGTLNQQFRFKIFTPNATECDCDLVFVGSQTEGNYVLNSCVFNPAGGGSDPGCNALNNKGTYTNINSILTTIDSSGIPETFK